jgi:hypothetical protein
MTCNVFAALPMRSCAGGWCANNPGPQKVMPDANGYPVLLAGQVFAMLNGRIRFRGEKELMPSESRQDFA